MATYDAIWFSWDGEHMTPASPRWAKAADQVFAVGERYPLVVEKETSDASRRHYFATIREIWENLPDSVGARFPSAEHLRKWALCRTGYCDEQIVALATRAEAVKVAALIRPMDRFAVITANSDPDDPEGPTTVHVYVAHSQSSRAMDADKFKQSKTAVLDLIAPMIGTTRVIAEQQNPKRLAAPARQITHDGGEPR